MVKRKIKKYQVWWIRSHWKTGVNGHCQVCVASPWAAMPERSPWYRHSTLKLDWSLPLSGGKLCSNVLVGEKLRPFIPSTPHLLSSMVVVVLPWGCVAASGSGALKKVNGIMKEEDNLQILWENLKSWFQTQIKSGKEMAKPSWGFEVAFPRSWLEHVNCAKKLLKTCPCPCQEANKCSWTPFLWRGVVSDST